MADGITLHVLGPAWDLPSVDPDCIAALALVTRYCRVRQLSLTIIVSHNNEKGLPALQDGRWTGHGVNAISRHIQRACADNNHIESPFPELTSEQQAQATALTTLLQVSGQQVLDVSLYVSSDAYHHATKPAFTKILPWYANYLIPPRRRHAAQARTDHLGLTSTDPDPHGPVLDSKSDLPFPALATLSNPHSSSKHASLSHAFKLKALADSLLEPLDTQLAQNTYLLATASVSAVDCIAYGYLALVTGARTPSSWTRDAMARFPRLEAYVARVSQELDLKISDAEVAEMWSARGPVTVHGAKWAVERESVSRATRYVVSYLGRRVPGWETLSTWAGMNAFARTVVTRVLPAGVMVVVAVGWMVRRRGGLIRGEPMYVFSGHGVGLGAAGDLLRGLDFSRA